MGVGPTLFLFDRKISGNDLPFFPGELLVAQWAKVQEVLSHVIDHFVDVVLVTATRAFHVELLSHLLSPFLRNQFEVAFP
jgi:hypothetical protein